MAPKGSYELDTIWDKNTSFFHHTAMHRRAYNKIVGVQDRDGRWVEDEKEIMQQFFGHFRRMFTSEGTSGEEVVLDQTETVIANEINGELCKDVGYTEVIEAAFQLGASKSLWPDGYPGVFYHSFWDQMRPVIYTI